MLVELQSLPLLVLGQMLFFLALGPIFYLLISYLAYAKESGHWQGLWHMTPVILSLVLAKSATQIIVFGTILQVCYAVASVRLIRAYHRAAFSCRSDAENTKLGGLYFPLSVIGLMSFITFAVLADWIGSSPNFKGFWLVLDFYLSSLMLLWILAKVIWSKRLFKGLRDYEVMLDSPTIAIDQEQRNENKVLFSKVEDALQTKKFYAESALSLSELAQKTGFEAMEISLAISQEAGLNFCDFINSHRVMEMKKRIDEGMGELSKINQLAMTNGFTSRRSFHQIFRRFVGSSPKAYLESLEQKLEN